jgi:long-chain acyl-CoA synthetase
MGKMAPALERQQRTVYHLLRRAVETWGDLPALHQPDGKGKYHTYSWRQYLDAVEEIAAALRSRGVVPTDIVGLASETRAEFYLADLGVMVCGGTAAAVYTSLPPADQVKTLLNCGPRLVFVENEKTLAALRQAGLDSLGAPYVLFSGQAEGAVSLDEFRAQGRRALAADPSLRDRLLDEVRPEHYAILYLTSGATGEPKMGLVTHNAIVANLDMGPPVLPVDNEDRTLAFLPSAHITQRLVMELLMVRMGVPVYFSEGLSKMPAELRAVRPTFFVAPPRVWERIYTSITTEIRKKPAALRKLIYIGLGVGSEYYRAKVAGREPSPWIKSSMSFFDKLVFGKIKQRLGGCMKIAISGAAPLGRELAEFYASIGLPLVEGYGLTEGGVVALNPWERPVAGSIGVPLPGVQIKLADDGELLIGGETLFSGYFKDPEASAAVLREGWLHTGDLAEIDSNGFIWITGRKKELIVSSNGKKIYPAKIETLFKPEPLINQVLLIGDRLPYMSALITVNLPAAESLNQGRSFAPGELQKHSAVQAELKRIIKQVNQRLAPFEQIRKFKVLEREFSIESGELTPTMKLRRAKVLDNYKSEIAELYAGREDFA